MSSMPSALRTFQDLSKNERRKTTFGVWIGVFSTFVANFIWNYELTSGPFSPIIAGFNLYQLALVVLGFYALHRMSKDLF